MDIPKTITRVFTKYDHIVQRLDFPTLNPLKPTVLAEGMNMVEISDNLSTISYHPTKIEYGLEGVVFIHYARA